MDSKNEKAKQGLFELKDYERLCFPIQILLPKSNEEWTEVISRLLSTFVAHKLQDHLNFSMHFLNFPELFQFIFILASKL